MGYIYASEDQTIVLAVGEEGWCWLPFQRMRRVLGIGGFKKAARIGALQHVHQNSVNVTMNKKQEA